MRATAWLARDPMTLKTNRTLIDLLLCIQVAAGELIAQESQVVTAEEIQQAIEALDDASFQLREQAVKDLWTFGEQAKPALLKVAEK